VLRSRFNFDHLLPVIPQTYRDRYVVIMIMTMTNPSLRIALLATHWIVLAPVGHGFVHNSRPFVKAVPNQCWSTLSFEHSSTMTSSSSPPPPPAFDPQYYSPPDQSALSRSGDNLPSRITLTRFLSQYVKDHPEVRKVPVRTTMPSLGSHTFSFLPH
jgi:hypothetical protein